MRARYFERVLFPIAILLLGSLGLKSDLLAQEEEEKPIKPAATKLDRPVDFERDVYPILDNKCIACHNLAIAENKLNLEDLESIMKGGTSGPAVVPKDPEKSLLYKLAGRSEEPVMPPMPNDVEASPLTPEELGIIRQWILEGAAAGAGRRQMDVQWGQLPDDLNPIYSLALSSDQRTVVATRANQLFVYHLPSGKAEQRLIDRSLEKIQTEDGQPFYPTGAAHRDFVHSVAIHPSGNLIATGGFRNVKLWERSSAGIQREIKDVGQVVALAVHPSGQWAAVATDNHQITLWNLESGAKGAILEGHSAKVNDLAFTPSAAEVVRTRSEVETAAGSLANAQRTLSRSTRLLEELTRRPDAKSEDLAEELQKRTEAVGQAKASAEAAEAAHAAATAAMTSLQQKIESGVRLLSVADDKTLKVWNVTDGTLDWEASVPEEATAVLAMAAGAEILTGAVSGKIVLWKRDAEAEGGIVSVREFNGHSKRVQNLVAVFPKAAQVISASEDGTARIWNAADGKSVRSLNHGNPLVEVAVRGDGAVIATAAANGTLRMWNAADGKQIVESKGAVAAIHEVARMTEADTVAKQLVALADKRMKEADKTVKEREATLKKSEEAVKTSAEALTKAEEKKTAAQKTLDESTKAAAEKPDDAGLKKKVEEAQKALDTASSEADSAKRTSESANRSVGLAKESLENGRSNLTELTAAKQQREQEQKELETRLADARKAETEAVKPLTAIAFSGNQRMLATSSELAGIQLWDGFTGKAVETLAATGSAGHLRFDADGSLVTADANGTLTVLQTEPTWNLVAVLGPEGEDPSDLSMSRFTDRVLALDFSRDGRFLATGGGEPSRSGELLLWDVAKRTLVREFSDAHSDTVFGIEFSRDGKHILSGAADKFVKIFEVETGSHVKSFEGHTHHVMDVSWQSDSSVIASAGADNAIKVWNVDTGEQQRTISNYQKQVTSLAFVGTTDLIISCGGDKTVRLHKTTNGQNVRTFSGSVDYVYAVAISRDQAAVIAGGEDGFVRVWNGQNGQAISTIDTSREN